MVWRRLAYLAGWSNAALGLEYIGGREGNPKIAIFEAVRIASFQSPKETLWTHFSFLFFLSIFLSFFRVRNPQKKERGEQWCRQQTCMAWFPVLAFLVFVVPCDCWTLRISRDIPNQVPLRRRCSWLDIMRNSFWGFTNCLCDLI